MQRKENGAIRIKSVQAASLYRYNNGYKFPAKRKKENDNYILEYKEPYIDFGNAVINSSLFSRFVFKHGVTVNKKGFSRDFVVMKFDWGVDVDASDPDEIKSAKTAQELRAHYYQNGAMIPWITYHSETGGNTEELFVLYRMLMRNPGKAKEGQCIFIRDELYAKTLNYITMGLWNKMPDKKGAKIVEMSAYAPLITATAIDFIHIPLKNIFVVKDQEVSVQKKAVSVKIRETERIKYKKDYTAFENDINLLGYTFYSKKAKKNPNLTMIKQTDRALTEHGIPIGQCPVQAISHYKNECYVERDNEQTEMTNILWDGMGLIDESIFPDDKNGFIYCRSHFFKSCLFRGNVQEYFRDYYGRGYDTAYATDMLGRKIKITDIKVIITENSLKWFKFIDLMSKTGDAAEAFRYYEKFMKKDGEMFAVVKTGHSSKYGRLQRVSFQINNTLLTKDENVLRKIAEVSTEFCNRLKLDDDFFVDYLEMEGTAKYSIYNVLGALYRWNDEFRFMEYFKCKKDKRISEFKKRLKLGKLLQVGDNLTICGNPVAMLMKVTGQNFIDENCFNQIREGIQCYTSRFEANERMAGFRSPHNSPNNIIHLINVYPPRLIRYFPNLGNSVIVINGIETDVQCRLNGQDLDSDSIFVTNQEEMVTLAKKAYIEYPTIINSIHPDSTGEYDKSMLSYAKMDSAISSAQYHVGVASNIAQLALSYYFDEGCNNRELEDIFIICSVLAQVAIDSAKKSYKINIGSELLRLNKMQCMERYRKYPVFYAEVQKYNNKKKKKKLKIKEEEVEFFNCPMDILYCILDKDILDKRVYKETNTKTYKESVYGVKPIFENRGNKANSDRKQCKKMIDLVNEYSEMVGKLDGANETYYDERMNEFNILMNRIKNITITSDTMYALLEFAFKSGNEYLRDDLLITLYDKDKDKFLNCFKKTEKSPRKNGESAEK